MAQTKLSHLFTVILLLIPAALSQNCPQITTSEISIELGLLALGDGGGPVTVNEFAINCQVVGTMKDTYQSLSITVNYDSDNLARIVFQCIEVGGTLGWTSHPNPLTTGIDDDLLNGDTMNCSSCTGPGQNDGFECVECHVNCQGVGQGACTGDQSTDCCLYYDIDTSVCIDSCIVANEEFYCLCNLTCISPATLNEALCECQCPEGLTGENCTININDCSDGLCLNGGTCNDLVNGYNCTCVDGYTGFNCSLDINDCADNPCLNGATCIDLEDDYDCICAAGYTGHNCSIDVNHCVDFPCLNEGTCINLTNDYECICADGYTGFNCSIDINDCADNPCLNGATCIDIIDDYNCICADGYTGRNCSIDINECDNNPCMNGGTCINTSPLYICNCSTEYTGTNCEYLVSLLELCSPSCQTADIFDTDLCLFYCQLRQWRDIGSKSGLDLPEINENMDSSLSDEELWRHAMAEYEKFNAVWLESAQNSLLDIPESLFSQNEEDSLFDEWANKINVGRQYSQLWREYVMTFRQDVTFDDFPEFTLSEDSTQEENSDIYNKYSVVWSDDLSTYINEFDTEE